MKLDEFHVFNTTFSPVYHRYTITGRNRGVCSSSVYLAVATCCQQRDPGQDLFDLVRFGVQYIYAITLDVGCGLRNKIAKVMLGNNIDNETMLDDLNVFLPGYSIEQCPLHFPAGNILMMNDPEF